jgi:Rrf2 family protein
MIRISKKADYAVYVLGVLAQRTSCETPAQAGHRAPVVSAHELAEKTRLSKALVANLLKNLTRAGLLTSTRGLHGGYCLARPPATITLASILNAVEGPFVLVTCASHDTPADGARIGNPLMPLVQSGHHDCSYSLLCPSRNPMRAVHARIARMLEDVTLAELCSAPARSESTG